MKKFVSISAAVVLLVSFPVFAGEQDKAAVRARTEAFAQVLMSQDEDRSTKLSAFYTANAKLIGDGADIVQGKAAIEKLYAGSTTIITEIEMKNVDIIVKDSIAYAYGYYTVAGATDGKAWGPVDGKYLDVWAKDDGQWYLDAEFYKNN
jgi:ketosteroid isomerase-like protein